MHTPIHINKVILDALNEIYPDTIDRKALIEAVQRHSKYSSYDKAEKFVTRQIFRLTSNKLLSRQGRIKDRRYLVSEELKKRIKDHSQRELSFNEMLDSELQAVMREVSIQKAENFALQELLEKYPSFKSQITALMYSGETHMLSIEGKLRAIERLISIGK